MMRTLLSLPTVKGLGDPSPTVSFPHNSFVISGT